MKKNLFYAGALFLTSILFFISLFLIHSCSFNFFPNPEEEVVFCFEALKYISPQKDLSWKLSYIDTHAQIIEIPIDSVEKYEKIEILLPPSFCTATLLSCDIEESENFEKALNEQVWGLIFPSKPIASPATTVASLVFFKLIQGSEDPKTALEYASFFNWEKLIESLEKRADPFELDIDLMASDIANGKFSSKSFKKLLL